ncbi:MAG: helix-turn-helix transcriptional regulator [Oscillospiraceae bacterium]|jgi:AraC-like DNA-binding protein|nr:helix-turn-helix transcriptional regulator [Oscillospiraceae bacterium]
MEAKVLADQLQTYIEAHLHEKLTLDSLAERHHYSKFYLNRVFQRTTGVTIGAYIRARRLEEAARELAETEKPIVSIAMDAGYQSQQAFTMAFREVFQLSPRAYRTRNRTLTLRSGLRMEVRAA